MNSTRSSSSSRMFFLLAFWCFLLPNTLAFNLAIDLFSLFPSSPATTTTTTATTSNTGGDVGGGGEGSRRPSGDVDSKIVIQAAQNVMANTGYFHPIDESLFADDFIFRGSVIGPLNKFDYKEVLNYFSIYKAFPDINPNCFGYTIDPEDPYRVWFILRATGTYQLPLGGPVLGNILPSPDNQQYRGSPETWSLTFDPDTMKCRLMTAGYVSDRLDNKATTNGIGLSFGILETLGLSLPAGVGDPRLQWIQTIGGPLSTLGIVPKAVSDVKDIPSWWTNSKRGADP